ncbi:MAG: outer membrane beta-barrel protein [Pseudomonadota bacterium]
MRRSIFGALSVLLFFSTSVLGQSSGFYFGGGVTYSDAVSNTGPWDEDRFDANSDHFGLNALIGYEVPTSSIPLAFEFGVDIPMGADFEVNSISCDTAVIGPYLCTADAILRARVIAHLNLSERTDLVFGLGYGALFGESGVDTGETDSVILGGVTASFGVQFELDNAARVRALTTYDRFNQILEEPCQSGAFPNCWDPEYDAVSVELSYIVPF